jgi:hypothetical protein
LAGGGTQLGSTREERDLRKISTAPFSSGTIQGFLPGPLRAPFTDPILGAGIEGIGDLIRNPGGLSPTVSDAIRQRLAAESESIAQNFRGIGANQAGRAARENVPVSIKTALGSALDVAQERAQRGARREALIDSDALRRQDLGQTYNLLDALLQFTSSGRGQAIQGLGAASNNAQQRQASNLAAFGSLLSNVRFPEYLGNQRGPG